MLSCFIVWVSLSLQGYRSILDFASFLRSTYRTVLCLTLASLIVTSCPISFFLLRAIVVWSAAVPARYPQSLGGLYCASKRLHVLIILVPVGRGS